MRGPCSLFALGALVLCTVAAVAGRPATAAPEPRPAILDSISRYRDHTWRWQRLMRKPLTPSSGKPLRSSAPEYRRWVLELWKARAARAIQQASRPPHLKAWRCIQRFEGRWDDPNAPYYGGLQMDIHFQRRYGRDLLRRKGTADNWTPLEQIWVAVRAHRAGRGFYPWPNTARMCGLL